MSSYLNSKLRSVGPQHFWHRYALNDREKYMKGYYGMYGPFRGPNSAYVDPRTPYSACSGSAGGCAGCADNGPFETFDGSDDGRENSAFAVLRVVGIFAIIAFACKKWG